MAKLVWTWIDVLKEELAREGGREDYRLPINNICETIALFSPMRDWQDNPDFGDYGHELAAALLELYELRQGKTQQR